MGQILCKGDLIDNMKVMYVTNDGKQFFSQEDAQKHEDSVLEAERKKKVLVEERNKDQEQITKLAEELNKKVDAFKSKYKTCPDVYVKYPTTLDALFPFWRL